jgi:hypothetical protein
MTLPADDILGAYEVERILQFSREEARAMRERAKIFTYLFGAGATVIESPLEDEINEWLAGVNGDVTRITQSESRRENEGQHVTICVWYAPHARVVKN